VERGEIPTERGDSWFSPKCIEVQPQEGRTELEVERSLGSGPGAGYHPQRNCECQFSVPVSETAGANLRRRKGNNPDPQLRSPSPCLVGKAVRVLQQPGGWLRSSHPSKSA
jgi:hypothetical protein